MRRPLTLFLLALASLAVASPAMAKDAGDFENDLVVLTGGARITEDQSLDDAVIFHGFVSVDGEVRGDLIVFSGNVLISGTVRGDVVVFNGEVSIGSEASIGGDLATTREPVIQEGAEIGGDVRKPSKDLFRPVEVFAARVALWIGATVSLLVLGLLLLGLAPKGMDAIAAVWGTSKGSAALWGFILLIGLPLGAGLAIVTVVGIPFGIGMLFALGLLYSIGYVAGAWALGRSLVGAPRGRAVSFLAGFAIVRLLGLIPIVGGIVSTLVLVFGLGLVTLAIWRSRAAPVEAPA